MTLDEILAAGLTSFSWPACGVDGNDAVGLMPSGMVLSPQLAIPASTQAPPDITYFVIDNFASVRCGRTAVPRAPCVGVASPAADRITVAVGGRKRPNDMFRHRVDYTYWMTGAERLDDITVEIAEPRDDSTIIAAVFNDDNRAADIYISGGIVRRTYLINVEAVTTLARARTDQIRLSVRETV